MNEPISIVTNEDCMDMMKRYPDNYFDICVCDPPYGVKRDKGFEGFEGFGGFGKPIARTKYSGSWDDNIPPKEYFDMLFVKCEKVLIFGGNFFTHLIPQGNHWIFWDKMNTMPSFGDGELIYTNVKRNSVSQITLEYNGLLGKEPNRIHATQKPIALYNWIFKRYAKQGDKILDTHLGSGSSRIAAYKAKLDFYACELDKEYYEAQEKRFDNFKRQLTLDL